MTLQKFYLRFFAPFQERIIAVVVCKLSLMVGGEMGLRIDDESIRAFSPLLTIWEFTLHGMCSCIMIMNAHHTIIK
jgi:hypothetical protein